MKKNKKWANWEWALLRKLLNDGKRISEITPKFNGRTEKAIRSAANKLGFKKLTYYSAQEDNIILRYYPTAPWDTILKLIPDKTKSSIKARAANLKVKREVLKNNRMKWPLLGHFDEWEMNLKEWNEPPEIYHKRLCREKFKKEKKHENK